MAIVPCIYLRIYNILEATQSYIRNEKNHVHTRIDRIADSESVHGTDLSSGNRQRLFLVFPHGVSSMYKIRSTRNEFQTIFNDTSQRGVLPSRKQTISLVPVH